MKRDRDGKEASLSEQPPPPPPRRVPASTGLRSTGGTTPAPSAFVVEAPRTKGAPGGKGSAGGVRPAGSSSSSSTSSSASPMATVPRRGRLGLGRLEGWRTTADEILLRAKGGGALGVASQGGVSARESVGEKRGGTGIRPTSRRKFAAVCSANFNRSMMAHKLLQEHRFDVQSYGTGRDVRLPGKDAANPEVFAFGTPYRDIFDSLRSKDEDFFRRNNLLGLVARNATIKAAPQRFQEIEGPDMAGFDVVLCFDSRVFYLVVEDLQSRDPETFKPLHVVNMTIKDSPEESAAAAGDVLDLCRMLDEVPQLEEEAARVLQAFTLKTKRTVLHQVCHV